MQLSRQAKAIDGIVSNIREGEPFAPKITFLIEEKFGKRHISKRE
jgi:hypothetical protein